MMAPGKTARAAVVALVVIWALLCGGLAWASRSAVRLDRLEQTEELRRRHEVKTERALSRMEAEVAPILYTERMRPYTQFRDYYVLGPHEVRYRRTAADASDAVEIASPLQDFRGPDWIILHFQVSDPAGWESPEFEDPNAEYALPAGAIPREQRAQKATAANWLAAMRERYTVASLQQLLASELTARRDGENEGAAVPTVDDEIGESGNDDASYSDGVNEVARRSERLLALQRELYPEYLCEPEAVARENLGSEVELPPDTDLTGCVPTYAPFMTETWLQLTDDGDYQLALIRQASVENSAYCTLQGLLIDWQRLRQDLLGQIATLFPNADLQPVFPREGAGAPSDGTRMHMIPARFIPGESPELSVAMSPGLGKGLAVAWGTTLLGLIAISYGVMKYVAMAQRRMQFVAAVTHELRTPLTSFQLYSDLLGNMHGEDGSKRRHYADVLGNESRRLARLVENVLAYSKVGDAQTRLDPRPVAASAILDDAVASGAEICRASGKELVVDNQCPHDCRIETDRAFVVQILGNLLENACKYSKGADDPRIWLSAAPGPAGGVTFEVDDAGPGVAARDRRAVFEPFRRGQNPSQRGAGGVGLGLSLSRYWARSLGGVLQLKRSPRNGTHLSCFSLTLPPHAPN